MTQIPLVYLCAITFPLQQKPLKNTFIVLAPLNPTITAFAPLSFTKILEEALYVVAFLTLYIYLLCMQFLC